MRESLVPTQSADRPHRRVGNQDQSPAPTIGAALNVTLLSFVDTCAIGINMDTSAIPDEACVTARKDLPEGGIARRETVGQTD
jgi:hypothetical protein